MSDGSEQPPAMVRASDLSTWAFCHRAWWLSRVQGVAHGDSALLESGTALHSEHGRRVSLAQWAQRLALLLLGLALLLAAGLVLALLAGVTR
jgi:hypothetical protein